MAGTEKLESFRYSIKLRSDSEDRKEVWMDITATNLETDILNSIIEELRKTAQRIDEILAGHEKLAAQNREQPAGKEVLAFKDGRPYFKKK